MLISKPEQDMFQICVRSTYEYLALHHVHDHCCPPKTLCVKVIYVPRSLFFDIKLAI